MALSSSSIGLPSSRQLSNFTLSFNYVQRRSELVNAVGDLFNKISPQVNVARVQSNSFNSKAYLDQRYTYSIDWQYPFFHIVNLPTTIVFPAYFLFKSGDIPSHFRIQDFNDPRLNDEQFLGSFAEWVNSVIQRINHSEQGDPLQLIEEPKDYNDFYHLQLFLMLLRDPVLFERAKLQTIGHELCHGLDENQSHFLFLESEGFENIPAIGTVSGLALCGLGLVLAPFASLPIALGIGGGGIALTTATVVLSRMGFSKCCEIEKKCDLGAVDALRDTSGAIYEFETMRQLNLLLKAKHPSLPFDDKGNNVYDVKHPRLTSRISYFQQHQVNT